MTLVYYGASRPTHDISLSDGVYDPFGLIYQNGPQILQEVPISAPMQDFMESQRSWLGGIGRHKFSDDPSGLFDSWNAWTMTDGRIFPMPKWRFGTGYRSVTTAQTGGIQYDNMTFRPLIALASASITAMASQYLATYITVDAATYNADKVYLWVRRRGRPGTLTIEFCHQSGGLPSTVLKDATLTTANTPDTLSFLYEFDWASTVGINNGSSYFIKAYGASTDNEANCWEIGCTTDTSAGYYSANNSDWTQGSPIMNYRVADTTSYEDSRSYYRWHPFYYYGALYAVHGTTGTLIINGDRGAATAGGATTVTDSGKSWTSNQFAGARVRIIDGQGQQGQDRQISYNTATEIGVNPAWDSNPGAGSLYIIYSTPVWRSITPSVSLIPMVGKPFVAGNVCYFPKGPYNAVRMRINGSTHEFAEDGTNQFWLGAEFTNSDANKSQVAVVDTTLSAIKISDAKTWGTNLDFGSVSYQIGTADTNITNIKQHDGILYVFKEDGIYTFNNFRAKRLGQGFSDVPEKGNGVSAASFNNGLYWSWAHSVQEMIGTQFRDILNYKAGYDGLHSDRTGVISSIVSALGWLFIAIDGGTSNYSSVLAWNQFGMHEIFRGWKTGARIRNMTWQPNDDGNPKLWIFIASDIVYIDFPRYSANPRKDTALYHMHEMAFTTPTLDMNAPLLYKFLHEFRVLVDDMRYGSPTQYGNVRVEYQINKDVGGTSWTELKAMYKSPADSAIMDRGELNTVRFRIRAENIDGTKPVIINGWDLLGWKLSPLKYQWIANFKTGSNQIDKAGATDTAPDRLVEWLQEKAQKAERLVMRSLNKTMDEKVVIISAPAITRESVDETGWQGNFQLLIREA